MNASRSQLGLKPKSWPIASHTPRMVSLRMTEVGVGLSGHLCRSLFPFARASPRRCGSVKQGPCQNREVVVSAWFQAQGARGGSGGNSQASAARWEFPPTVDQRDAVRWRGVKQGVINFKINFARDLSPTRVETGVVTFITFDPPSAGQGRSRSMIKWCGGWPVHRPA